MVIYVQRFSAACIFLIGMALFASTLFNAQKSETGKGSEVNKILTR
jgi:hypothetical protein